MQDFNVFTQLAKEVEDFGGDITVAELPSRQDKKNVRFGKRDSGGYDFNQSETLNTIDFYYNSKYTTGDRDSEGKQKLFLNICRFKADVARMRTDLDVKNFVFVPETYGDRWGAWLMGRQFKSWAEDNEYGQLLNDLNRDYSKYGSCVVKRVGKELKRVPLKQLINSPDVESLDKAAKGGGYVIEKHEMTVAEIKEMKNWELPDLDIEMDRKIEVFERYGLVPKSWVEEANGREAKESDHYEYVLAMVVLMPETPSHEVKEGEETGVILFAEEIKELPYEEAHWDKQDGRWLGVGEVEKQFENQVARNLIENLRRKTMQWSAKKIFQSTDTELAKNLVRDVRDGEVLRVSPGGDIQPVNVQTQALPDFNSATNVWDNNSDENAFSFEVATGEALPSGTPFRLGIVLSAAVNTYFDLKRENFGLFLKRTFFDLQVPIFQSQTKEHVVRINSTDEGAQALKEAMIEAKINKEIKKAILEDGRVPDANLIRVGVEDALENAKDLFVNVPDRYYKDIKFHVDLVITGESMEQGKKIETLTNIVQLALQNPGALDDPRTRRLLDLLLAQTGENLSGLIGKSGGINQLQAPQTGALPQFAGQGTEGFAETQAVLEGAEPVTG